MKRNTLIFFLLYLVLFLTGVFFAYQYYFKNLINGQKKNSISVSTSAEKIYYTQENNLFALNPNSIENSQSQPVNRLQSTGEVDNLSFNKEKGLLAYKVLNKSDESEIWQVNISDNSSEKLVSNLTPGLENLKNFRLPKFSKDNNFLAFIASKDEKDYLFTLEVEGHALVNRLPKGEAKIAEYDWNAENTIYYITKPGLITAVNKKAEKTEFYQNQSEITDLLLLDEKIILKIKENKNENLYFLENQKLTKITDLIFPKTVTRFDFSSRAEKIVYEARDSSANSSDLFVVNLDGTNLLQLTTDGHSSYPIFSPDGGKVAYYVDNKGIYSLILESKEANKLLNLKEELAKLKIWR